MLTNGTIDVELDDDHVGGPVDRAGGLDLNSQQDRPPGRVSQNLSLPFGGPWNLTFWGSMQYGPCSDTGQIPEYIGVTFDITPNILNDYTTGLPQCSTWYEWLDLDAN